MSGSNIVPFNAPPNFDHLNAEYMANVLKEWEDHLILPFITQAIGELLEMKRESEEALLEYKATLPISAIRGRLWVIHTRDRASPTPQLAPYVGWGGQKRLSPKIFRILVLNHAIRVFGPRGFRCQKITREFGHREVKLPCLEISWNPPA